MNPLTKIKAIDALFVQAGIAAALSFSHIHDIARAAGQGSWQAWAYPVSVDLLLFAAWRRIRAGRGGKKEWVWFIIALAASLGANLATADLMVSMPASLRLVISGWPAVAFLGGTLLVHGAVKTDAPSEPVDTPVTVVEVPAPAIYPQTTWTDADALESLREPAEEEVRVPEPAPAVPETTMDPEKVIEEGWRYGIPYKDVAVQVGKHETTIYRRYRKLDKIHGKPAELAGV